MKVFSGIFQGEKAIDQYRSQGASILRLATLPSGAQVHCIAIASGGVLGSHPAASNQLFIVVQGEGRARGGEPPEESPLQVGTAVFWAAGEWHETRSENGLVAIVVEGEDLQPWMGLQLAATE